MKLPITKRRVRNHLAYAWWQYVLLVCIAVFGWNLIYTTTRYRSPEPLKVEWYGEGYVTAEQQAQIDAMLDRLHGELFPDMEEVTFTPVAYDDTYGDMQLFVWASAGQGDLYTLSAEAYKNLASGGVMLDLQPYVDDGTLNVEGLDLKNGYVTDNETGKRYLMGIPMDSLAGLESYGVATQGKVMSILVNGGNTENTMKLMKWLLENMRE